jgi:bacillithiol system protein YtxJ
VADIPALTDPAQVEALLAAPLAVIYKHSTRCAFSAHAHDEVARFAGQRPDVTVRLVDVLFDRALSLDLAERLGVEHASPQVIVLRAGTVVWHGSHGRIKAAALHQALR